MIPQVSKKLNIFIKKKVEKFFTSIKFYFGLNKKNDTDKMDEFRSAMLDFLKFQCEQ